MLRFRMRPFGMTSYYDAFHAVREYNLSEVASRIKCPMLITDPEGEQFFPGQARKLYDALECPKAIVHFTREQGADQHCEVAAPGYRDYCIYNWLDALVSGKVLCGGQQTLSIQCRGGNLSGKRFELRAAENWAGAPLPRFSTMRDAHRPVRFLRVDRPSPSPGVSEMRGPLRRSSSAEEAFLLGSVLGDGLRATDLPREPAGHRSLPPIRDRETLSPGVSRHGGAQHSGRRQRNTRLAHLRRVCPCLD